MTVAERIKAFRKLAGLTQKELGGRMGVSDASIAQYESGQRKPKIDTLRRIADALGVGVDELMCEEEISTHVNALLSDYENFSIPEALIISTFRSLNLDGKEYVLRAVETVGRANGILTPDGSKLFFDAIKGFRAIKEADAEKLLALKLIRIMGGAINPLDEVELLGELLNLREALALYYEDEGELLEVIDAILAIKGRRVNGGEGVDK